MAQSRPSVSGAIAPLTASAQLTVGATPSTPTPGPSPTVTPSPVVTATPTTTTTTPTPTTSKSGLLLVVLIVLLVLVILAIFGVLIWYVAGTRPPAGAPVAPPPGRARAPVAPRRGQSGWQSASGWQSDDEWESQQGPWEEDEQGGWNDLPTEWDANPWPQQQGGSPGRGNSGAQRPTPRGPNRDDWQGRNRPGQEDW